MNEIIEKIKNIDTAGELKEIGTVEDIVNQINKVINPMKINSSSYDDLYQKIKILKEKCTDFSKEEFFQNERKKYLFCLTKVEGEKRNEFIGLTNNLYDDSEAAKKWYYKISKILRADVNFDETTAEAFNNLNGLYNIILDAFKEDDSDE